MAAGLTLALALGGYQDSAARPPMTSQPQAVCTGDTPDLAAARIDITAKELGLTYERRALRQGEQVFGKPRVIAFSGGCASLVQHVLGQIIGLRNATTYWRSETSITPHEVGYAEVFQKASDRDVIPPPMKNARFISAERIHEGRVAQYVGVWKDRSGWLVADFTTKPGTRQGENPKPLLRSRLPLRSVNFFPSIDTNSGGLDLVQETPTGDIRAISHLWWHGVFWEGILN